MKFKSPDNSACAWLVCSVFLCCSASLATGIQHYDTEYMSGNECVMVLKRTHAQSSNFPFLEHSFSNPISIAGLEVLGCIRYNDVNEALRLAKKQLGYKQFNVNLAFKDDDLLDNLANVFLETTRILAQKYQLTFDEINYGLPTIDTSKTDIWDICPDMLKPSPCTISKFRTYDGQCSSLKNSMIGMARTPFKRFLPSEYSDGISAPKVSPVDGKPLPSVRELSVKVHPDITQLTNKRSYAFATWGQLVDKDMIKSDFSRKRNGAEIMCCPFETSKPPLNCNPIRISSKDPYYSKFNSTCMQFNRNLAGIRSGCALGPRIPTNFVTARLDANSIYGSTESDALNLRLGSKGQFRMWPKYEDLGLKDLLPPMTERPEKDCLARPKEKYCFLTGDSNSNLQPQMIALHHVYKREHNRIAAYLSHLNPHWNDERLYQEARNIIIAIVQHITFNEFLPALLGPQLMHIYNLTLLKEGYWHGYDRKVVLGTDLTLQSAAFRWGHTVLSDKISLYDKHHEFLESWELHSVTAQPFNLYQPGVIDKVIGGMVNSPLESFDRYLSSQLTKHLFQTPTEAYGRDLASLDIHRGRDNALPGYNDHREWCGMPRVKTFEEMNYYLGNQTALEYSKIYRHPDDVDLWSAGTAEFPVEGGLVGPTFGCIIARQMNRNRRGDRFWYENPGFPSSFTPGQLQEIRKITNAKIICENADDFPTIQKWTMYLPHPDKNPRYRCKDLPNIDLKYWIEDTDTTKFQYKD